MSSDEGQETHAGGLVTGPAGEDSIPVRLMAGEHVYGPDGRLLLIVPAEER